MSDVPPPQELKYRWRIDQYGPPYDGGWMNWPAGLLNRMSALNNVNELMQLYRDSNKSLTVVSKRYGRGTASAIVALLKVLNDG